MISINIETYCLSQKTAETISMKKSGVNPISGDYLHFCCLITGESAMLPPFIYCFFVAFNFTYAYLHQPIIF